jgi:hypothetical protein
MEEFSRLFKMFVEIGKKESATNAKLVRALEKCDKLEFEIEKLRNDIAEMCFLDDL